MKYLQNKYAVKSKKGGLGMGLLNWFKELVSPTQRVVHYGETAREAAQRRFDEDFADLSDDLFDDAMARMDDD
jgi:hypothetical protein